MTSSNWNSASGRTAGQLFIKRMNAGRIEVMARIIEKWPGADPEGLLEVIEQQEPKILAEASVYANAIRSREVARLVTNVMWRIHNDQQREAQRRHAELLDAIGARDAATDAYELLRSMDVRR